MRVKLPKYFLQKEQMVGTVTFSVLFAIVFLNIYIPFSQTAWFRLGASPYFLDTAGFVFMSLLILIASRVVMYKTQKFFEMTYLQYILWCIAEVVMICLFYTFITTKVQQPFPLTFWQIFPKSLLYGTISLIIPYIISGMYYTILDKDKTIKLMSSSGVVTDDSSSSGGLTDQITLYDNNGELKLSVRVGNLFYIESDDNYINVWYTDNKGELCKYMMRCRLKTVEENFKGSSLMRCHRKYIVNAEKVKVLRKEHGSYFLDMDNDAIDPIPVTKTYVPNILERFS